MRRRRPDLTSRAENNVQSRKIQFVCESAYELYVTAKVSVAAYLIEFAIHCVKLYVWST